MALANICDGCREICDAELAKMGYGRPCEYCPTCASLGDQFLAEIDEVHEESARLFQKKRDAVVKKYRKFLRSLPYGG